MDYLSGSPTHGERKTDTAGRSHSPLSGSVLLSIAFPPPPPGELGPRTISERGLFSLL